jgi:hypothetical protein
MRSNKRPPQNAWRAGTGWSDRVAGRELHPLKINTFSRRTLGLAPASSFLEISRSTSHSSATTKPLCTDGTATFPVDHPPAMTDHAVKGCTDTKKLKI